MLMICPHCRAQWKLPPDNHVLMKECPFCKGNMCSPDHKLTTFEAVLQEIVFRFGVDVLSNGPQLVSLFSNIAPDLKKEIILLQFLLEYGDLTELCELRNTDAIEQNAGYKKQIRQLTQNIIDAYQSFLAILNIRTEPLVESRPKMEYEYSVIGDGTIELTSCKGPLQEEISFPDKIGNMQVISIAGTIFGTSKSKDSDRNKVKSVYIPEGITTIGASAFHGCKSLNSITLPQSLRTIGDYTFKSCKGLYHIVLPASLLALGKGAFSGSNLTSITIPEGIVCIPDEAFKNCKSLAQISLPNSTQNIGKEAFSGCKSIENIVLPQNVKSIGTDAFQWCTGLTNVTLPEGVQVIDFCAFANCEALTTINLPNSISVIECGCFSRCFALTDIVLPKNITVIELEVFDRCRSLTTIEIPEGVTSINPDAFYGCGKLERITIPNSVNYISQDAFTYCEDLTVHCYQDSYAYTFALEKKWNIELLS